MGYSPFELDQALKSITILVDTREQDTPALHRRLSGLGCAYRRQKLDSGDYGAEYTDRDGQCVALPIVVERKMALDELCNCFTRGRERFKREFERAKDAGNKMYLLVENANWENAFSGKYRSKLNPESLIASLLAWSIQYGFQVFFCKPESTGKLIYKIMRYELKELLENDGG